MERITVYGWQAVGSSIPPHGAKQVSIEGRISPAGYLVEGTEEIPDLHVAWESLGIGNNDIISVEKALFTGLMLGERGDKHSAAVFDVLDLKDGRVVSASADATIR